MPAQTQPPPAATHPRVKTAFLVAHHSCEALGVAENSLVVIDHRDTTPPVHIRTIRKALKANYPDTDFVELPFVYDEDRHGPYALTTLYID